MEELRSTEALDREILEDARKKAQKILKTADESVKSQAQQWEKKTQETLAEIQKTYAQNTEKAKHEILARFPLDKLRLRSEIAENFLRNAMNNFLKNLSRSSLPLILEQELEKRLASCGEAELKVNSAEGGKIILAYQKMEENELRIMLGKIVEKPEVKGKCRLDDFQIEQDTTSGAAFPAVVLNTPVIRITASVENAATEIMMNKRAELAVSLLGEGALND
jgi:vacuolar-type H+-ATPase subunit E/Vma4